jgi:hypothetical protein
MIASMTHDATESILVALFCLCRDTRPVDATTLGQFTGLTPTQAAQTLVALERSGLVDASRARLTMLGLARAAQLERKPRSRIKPPVAARSSAHATRRSVNDGQEPFLEHIACAGVGQ